MKEAQPNEKVIRRMADQLVEKPIVIKIEILKPSLKEKAFIQLGIRKSYRSFTLKPIVLGKLIQISKLLLKIDMEQVDKSNLILETALLANAQGYALAEIIATALTTKKHASKKLIEFIVENVTVKDLQYLAMIVVSSLDVSDFLSTITTLTGINLLKSEVSPQREEIIASTDSLVLS